MSPRSLVCSARSLGTEENRAGLVGAILRPGNVHTADGGLEFVLPILR
ncbi:MAG: hypothetical protein H0X65_16000 [Gemmatimonadetes bacterium]|nr:hypothetical protein [Gemmatimonadota bacterium]